MAGDARKLQPIIVKRVKRAGHAHHGGAWKIAYADFVTAMMAFFLLMWLLGSTTEGDRKGIADFFNSPLKLSLLGGGTGSGDASHVVKGGGQDLSRTHGQVKAGEIEAERRTINLKALKAEQKRAEAARLEALKQRVSDTLAANTKLAELSSQIRLDMTSDGMRVQIVEVPNRLTLEGHTDAAPFGAGERGYSNWELSADRANASRRELVAGGLPDSHGLRVQGLASSVPHDRDNPLAAANRRISIIVMNRDAEERMSGTGTTTRRRARPSSRRGEGDGFSCPWEDAMSTGLKFLIVDDFSTMRRIVRGLLTESGYANAEEAEDGVIALRMLRGTRYDFVVSDINMPNMDGFELLKQIKADPGLRQLPVLMVTAEARKEDIVRAAQGGAAGYIVKPFTRATLEDKVRKILQKLAQR